MLTELSTKMIVAYIGCCVLGLVCLCVFLKMRVKEASAKCTVAKAMVSVFFILSWLVLAHRWYLGRFEMFIGAGLLFGLLGDIWLDLKFCCRDGDSDFYTYAGFISFAIGHFAYIAAIITGVHGKFDPISVLPALGVAVVVGLVIFFGEKVMGLHYGKFKLISTLYGALLFFMTAFALFAGIFTGGIMNNKHLLMLFIGGVFFAISDLILSGTYFGEGKNRPVDIVTNHVTYYIAQYIIAATLFLS